MKVPKEIKDDLQMRVDNSHFRQKHGMIVTADAIMYHVDLGKYVFIRRGKEPFKGQLAMAGGVIEMNETAEEAIIREVKEETNLDFYTRKLFKFMDKPDRDPRGRTVSAVFVGLCKGKPKAGDDAGEIVLMNAGEVKCWESFDLWAFDHGEVIMEAII